MSSLFVALCLLAAAVGPAAATGRHTLMASSFSDPSTSSSAGSKGMAMSSMMFTYGRMEMYSSADNGPMYSSSWDGDDFGSWGSMGGVSSSKPGAAAYNGHELVAVRGTDTKVYYQRRTLPGEWKGWEKIDTGSCTSAPAVAGMSSCREDETVRFDVYCRGSDGAVHMSRTDAEEMGWTGIGGQVPEGWAPAACALNTGERRGTVVVVMGSNGLYVRRSDYTGQEDVWGSWAKVPDAPKDIVRSPAVTPTRRDSSRVGIVAVGDDKAAYWIEMDVQDMSFGSWEKMGSAACESDPAAGRQCPSGGEDCWTVACYGADDQMWYAEMDDYASNGYSWKDTGLYTK